MTALRILHVIPSIARVHGGPSEAIRLIERALTDAGGAVETVTTNDEGPGQCNGLPVGGVALETAGVIRRQFAKRLEFYKVCPSFVPWIFRHVRDYDVVHIHALFSFMTTVAALAAASRGVPYIVRPLGTLGRYGVTQRRARFKRLSLAVLEGPILRNAAAVHFTSDQEADEARVLRIPMRQHVIPLGLLPVSPGTADLALQRHPELAGGCNVLYLSRLDPKKNVEALLQALAALRDELPGARLIIAGTGEPLYVMSLQRMAVDLGLAQTTVWTGHVEGDMKASLFAAARMFVLPSYSENFGIAVAEALQAGLPCIVSRGVALADAIVKGEAGAVTGTDQSSIAAAIKLLATDDILRNRMAANAMHLAQSEYLAKVMAARLIALYRACVAPSLRRNARAPPGVQ